MFSPESKRGSAFSYEDKVYITYNGDIFCAKCFTRNPICVIHKAGCHGEVYTKVSPHLPKLVTTTEGGNVVTRLCNT